MLHRNGIFYKLFFKGISKQHNSYTVSLISIEVGEPLDLVSIIVTIAVLKKLLFIK